MELAPRLTRPTGRAGCHRQGTASLRVSAWFIFCGLLLFGGVAISLHCVARVKETSDGVLDAYSRLLAEARAAQEEQERQQREQSDDSPVAEAELTDL